ncbi:MAG: ATP-binding cassette domain-containing protein [Actinobacteria bacterium]|nr:ATP-binding cassette domain-containing protein [Actinomycetota bacterium]
MTSKNEGKTSKESLAIRSLLAMARPHRLDYFVAVVAFFIKDSPAWILPLITALVVDTVVQGGPISTLFVMAALAVLALVQNYPMHMVFIKRSSRATRSIAYELRTSLTDHLQKVTMNFHQRVSGSVIQTKIVRDVENIEIMIQQSLPIALSGVFSLLGALVVIAFNIPIFLAVFALVIPVGLLVVVLFRKRSRDKNEEFRFHVEQYAAQVGEMTTMLPIVRAHAVEATAKQLVNDSAYQLRNKAVELDWLNGRFGSLAWLSYQMLGVASLIFAATLAILEVIPISPGQVVLVATYFAVMMGTAIGLLNIVPALAKGIESVRSIDEILSSDDLEHNEGKPRVESISGEITLKNLGVVLGDKSVLDDLELRIPAKSMVAFVGPSGSGKTTLIQTILGLVRPSSGAVFYDQKSIADIDMRSVRRHIAYVPQESVVLDGSLRDNIALGLAADDELIREALKLSNLSELVSDQQGLDLVIGRSGTRLSVGQRQRLAIARALYRKPTVLVLDEATSSLDLESERFIQETLETLSGEITLIVVAHRLSTVRAADRIYFLDSGVVSESGTHEELMKQNGAYSQMVAGKEML